MCVVRGESRGMQGRAWQWDEAQRHGKVVRLLLLG